MTTHQAEKSRYREDCTLWACASIMGAEPMKSLAQMALARYWLLPRKYLEQLVNLKSHYQCG